MDRGVRLVIPRDLQREIDRIAQSTADLVAQRESAIAERDALRAQNEAMREFLRNLAQMNDPKRCDEPGCTTHPTLHSATYFGEVNTCEAHRSLHRDTARDSYHTRIMRLIGGAP